MIQDSGIKALKKKMTLKEVKMMMDTKSKESSWNSLQSIIGIMVLHLYLSIGSGISGGTIKKSEEWIRKGINTKVIQLGLD